MKNNTSGGAGSGHLPMTIVRTINGIQYSPEAYELKRIADLLEKLVKQSEEKVEDVVG